MASLICKRGLWVTALALPALAAPPPLPRKLAVTWPGRPVFEGTAYPNCVGDWRRERGRFNQFQAVQTCINRLETYNLYTISQFPREVFEYGKRLIVVDARVRAAPLPLDAKIAARDFISEELAEFRSLDKDGSFGHGYAAYYRTLDAYKRDLAQLMQVRVYLQRGI